MNGKAFFDTNILVYMQDTSNMQKHQKARSLFFGCVEKRMATISTQSLQEFYNVTTNKLKQDKQKIKKIIHDIADTVPVVQVTPVLIEAAIDISIQTQFSFWDSLIVAAAQSAGCSILYSEDLNNGQTVNGVTVRNPFTE